MRLQCNQINSYIGNSMNNELLGDLDMDLDIDEVEIQPEFVDLSAGNYICRVAGIMSKPVTVKDDEDDEVDSTRLSIVFQTVVNVAVEEPEPEIGGIFNIGGILAFPRARSQVVNMVKKGIKLADPDFFKTKHSLGAMFMHFVALYGDKNFLDMNITLRDEKYPNIRTMRLAEKPDINWDGYVKAQFEWTP